MEVCYRFSHSLRFFACKMATFFYRQKHSRRRLAALNFLSNISLDGSFEDLKCAPSSKITLLSDPLENDRNIKKVPIKANQASLSVNDNQNSEIVCTVTLQENICDNQVTCSVMKGSTLSSEEKTKIDNALVKMENSSNAVRDRSPTCNSIFKGQKGAALSNTNICNSPIIAGTTSLVPHSEKASVDFVEFPTPSYLFPNSTRSRKVFLATHQRVHTHQQDQVQRRKKGEFRSDSGRRRHPSSSTRPVSSTDYPDLYHLLGLTKPGDGQVVSYCQMLVPSGYAGRELITPRRFHVTEGSHFENDRASKVSTVLFRSHDRPNHMRPSSPLQMMENMKIDNEELGIQTSFSNLGHFGYHPSLLDDPELIAGKHSTRIALLTFSSYMTSVIDYVKPSDLKKELNDKFREKFPHIHLTLSKIRSLKREMRKVAKQDSGTGTDLLTVAQSYVFFEKLVLRGLVHKGNRKLCAGATLLLSAKMNDVKGDSLKTLIEEIQNNFRISRRELFASEFAVLVALEFSLHSPTWEIFSHYQRLLYDS
ncbi:putative CDK5 and ABL1 enzyme substrate 1 [Daphnia magna]|uniref:Putative CDK5 and ABL1 enzyme substrate 1 n=1 Tax=Daphnia magna TaxID=35525 RepID=A0A164YZM8_9CRUS|nr:putative CDK5 and ABL1 enzyme substrate 1 [Daphnia magna]